MADRSNQLWKLLVQMTLRKAAAQGYWHTAGIRDVRQEDSNLLLLSAVIAGGPNADDAQNLDDEIKRALLTLPSDQRERYRRWFDLKLANFSTDEIAQQLGIARRRVERMVNRIENLLRPDGSGG